MNKSTLIEQSKRIVIKIGSAILVDSDKHAVRAQWLDTLTHDIATLLRQGKEIIIVSSGAIALGRQSLGISSGVAPSSIPLAQKQAAAALGQVRLIRAYEDSFAVHHIQTALILLTPQDTENRKPHLNARDTIHTLIEAQKIPVINENDTVSTDEIRFGDNDRLAARVAQMCDADLLIQLSTTDGLYTDNPDINPNAKHIAEVSDISDDITQMAKAPLAGISTGGMQSKLLAADIAMKAGIHMVITNGKIIHPIKELMNGNNQSTLFIAADVKQNARKRWIGSHIKTKGTITIDNGAVKALQGGKSLLPAGITAVKGIFDFGDPVEIIDTSGHKIALGLSSYAASEIEKIKGCKSDDIAHILGYARNSAVIHRSNMVLQS